MARTTPGRVAHQGQRGIGELGAGGGRCDQGGPVGIGLPQGRGRGARHLHRRLADGWSRRIGLGASSELVGHPTDRSQGPRSALGLDRPTLHPPHQDVDDDSPDGNG